MKVINHNDVTQFDTLPYRDRLPDKELTRIRASKKQADMIKTHFRFAMERLLEEERNKLGIPPELPKSSIERKALLLILSDTHFGEIVKKYKRKEKQRVVTYDFEIGHQRMNELFDRSIIEYLAKEDEIDEFCIFLAGDMIEGDGSIFHTQAFNLQSYANEQIVQFSMALFQNIVRLVKVIGKNKPLRIFGVRGNHGEQRGKAVTHPADNWDNTIYLFLQALITRSKIYGDLLNVSLEYSEDDDDYIVTEVKGQVIYMKHTGPKNISTPSGKMRILGYDHNEQGVDLVIYGHWHDGFLGSVGRTSVCRVGCMPGPNNYSDGFGIPGGPAQQAIILTSQQRVIESYIPYTME